MQQGIYASVRDNFPKNVVSTDGIDLSQDSIRHRNICDFLLTDWE